MKRFVFFTLVTTGILCSYTMHAMEEEQKIIEINPIIAVKVDSADLSIPITDTSETNSNQLHKRHHHHDQHVKLDDSLENVSKENLYKSLKNLHEQPKPEQDELEKIIEHDKKLITNLTQKYEKLAEHVTKIHTTVVDLKKPVHYELHLPSAFGTSIISLYALRYMGQAAYHIIKHDEVKKNFCKVLFAGGVLAWSGAQAWHYWNAFYTPTLSEKENKKINEVEHQILNDETKK